MVGPEDTLFSWGLKSTIRRPNIPELSTCHVTSPLLWFTQRKPLPPAGGPAPCWSDMKRGGHPSPGVLVLGSESGCFSHGHAAWRATEGTRPLCPFPAMRLTLTHRHFIS